MTIEEPVKENLHHEAHSFEEIFRSYHGKVYSVCLRMTGIPSEAEDLTQEVFVQVFRKLGTFRGESAFSTWLHRLTVNQVLMHFRKIRRRKEQITEDGEMPERSTKSPTAFRFSALDRIALGEAIVKLSPGYRLIFILHDVHGLQHHEISKILGCSVGTSKSQLHKARLKLRGLLRQRSTQQKTEDTEVRPRRPVRAMCLSALEPQWNEVSTVTR